VVLHVGTPKSGTTFVQRTLARHRHALRQRGAWYPGDRPSHFLEALDLRGAADSRARGEDAAGAWDALVAQVRTAPEASVILSHEMFGGIGPGRIRRAVASFAPRPVEVVITCRDLARQLPAVWQEAIKNGATSGFVDFLDAAWGAWEGSGSRRGPWAGQNLAGVAGRWAEAVGADSVTLVTVPRTAPPEELWRRFAVATRLPHLGDLTPVQPRNASMGAAESELLRRLTEHLPPEVSWAERTRLLKRGVAARHLAGRAVAGPIVVPEPHRDRVRTVVGEQRAALVAAGYPIVGDLADLDPSFRDGSEPGVDAVLDAAVGLVVAMLLDDGA
jgi:hypothetical protein